MNLIRSIRHLSRLLTGFAGALLGLAVSAPAAFSMRLPNPGGASSVSPASPSPTFTHSVAASGMPGWQIAVIVAAVAVLAATIAIVVVRARAARRTEIVPAT